MDFRNFLTEADRTLDDIEKTLKKLPAAHRALIQGYKYKFQAGNTMHGDSGHVGLIDDKKREIILAAPYNFSREFCLLHEVAHLVYKTLSPEKKKEWAEIARNTKNKIKDSVEELFAHAYAAAYVDFVPTIHDHKEWKKFVKSL